MSAILKFFVIFAIAASLGLIINQLIPSSISASINNSTIYFLKSMAPMNFVIPMDTVYTDIQIIGSYIYGVVVFLVVIWLAHFFTR